MLRHFLIAEGSADPLSPAIEISATDLKEKPLIDDLKTQVES